MLSTGKYTAYSRSYTGLPPTKTIHHYEFPEELKPTVLSKSGTAIYAAFRNHFLVYHHELSDYIYISKNLIRKIGLPTKVLVPCEGDVILFEDTPHTINYVTLQENNNLFNYSIATTRGYDREVSMSFVNSCEFLQTKRPPRLFGYHARFTNEGSQSRIVQIGCHRITKSLWDVLLESANNDYF